MLTTMNVRWSFLSDNDKPHFSLFRQTMRKVHLSSFVGQTEISMFSFVRQSQALSHSYRLPKLNVFFSMTLMLSYLCIL